MPTLKSRTETFIVVDYNDLDKFIQETTGVKNYEFMAAEEGPKDGYASITVDGHMDEFQGRDYDAFIKGKKNWLITRTVMNQLCNSGLIPAGKYLIACFW